MTDVFVLRWAYLMRTLFNGTSSSWAWNLRLGHWDLLLLKGSGGDEYGVVGEPQAAGQVITNDRADGQAAGPTADHSQAFGAGDVDGQADGAQAPERLAAAGQPPTG
ncbi:hypothetical protein NS337_13825 [Pseudomonas oryzihabitans]|nr:hypothetical protein NS337_13825 [Pseudomonas psychrotolerans]